MSCYLGKKTNLDRVYLERMSKVIFRVGLSYDVVENKWTHIKKEFEGFDIHKINKITHKQMSSFLRNENLIRNPKKLNSVKSNAKKILKLKESYGSLGKYFKEMESLGEEKFIKEVSKAFELLGEKTTVYFLRSVGFPLQETMKSTKFNIKEKK